MASAVLGCCRSQGFEVRPGVLELRPNLRGKDADFLTIRAPLSGEGNALWVEDMGLVDEPCVFRKFWRQAQARNRLELHTASHPRSVSDRLRRTHPDPCSGALSQAQDRLKEGFTGRGQTEELKLKALQVARLVEGIDCPRRLRSRCSELVTHAPGFTHYCRHQREIQSGRAWSDSSLQRALSLSPGGYIGTWRERANRKRNLDAAERAREALHTAFSARTLYDSERSAIEALRACGGPARSWWLKQSNHCYRQELKQILIRGPTSPTDQTIIQESA